MNSEFRDMRKCIVLVCDNERVNARGYDVCWTHLPKTDKELISKIIRGRSNEQ